MFDKNDRRESVIRVRVSDVEKEKFKAYSKALGYKTVSDMIRSLIEKDVLSNENEHGSIDRT